MPTYGYRCPKCSTEFEVWQSMRDHPGAPCPNCGAAAARQFFPAGIVFKGSGFYKTDSRGASTSSITSEGGESKGATNGTKPDSAKPEKKSSTPEPASTPVKKAASTDAAS
ncbi:MAG: FmdB family zinc ribbon protein [Candidatus Dormiibacterota bacterium]